MNGESGGNPEGADFAADDGPAFEEHAVGGEEYAAELLGLAHEVSVWDILLPEGFAAGGAQPAGESTEAGVAVEA